MADPDPILSSGFAEINSNEHVMIIQHPQPQVELPSYFIEISTISKYCIVAYFVFFVASTVANVYVFKSINKQMRVVKTRTSLLLLNLCIADLIVTFFLMPMEIGWRITIQWYGGNVLCKMCQFFRAFGLYLSSMVVICISVDRFYAIIYPLKLSGARKRVKVMLGLAWMSAVMFALPQIFVFHVTSHPKYPSFKQCVTKSFLEHSPHEEIIYNVFSISALYVAPLAVIVFTFSKILWKIHRKSRSEVDFTPTTTSLVTGGVCRLAFAMANHTQLQDVSKRSTHSMILWSVDRATVMTRARGRTLRLTLLILLSFLFCWTPYVFMTLWYIFDRKGAQAVNQGVQEALFLMAVANSILDPIIYGTYKKKNNQTHNNCRKDYSLNSCPYTKTNIQKQKASYQVQAMTNVHVESGPDLQINAHRSLKSCLENPLSISSYRSLKCKCKNGY